MAIGNINAKIVNRTTTMCVVDYHVNIFHGRMFVECSFTSR